jgi:hypothetical protein
MTMKDWCRRLAALEAGATELQPLRDDDGAGSVVLPGSVPSPPPKPRLTVERRSVAFHVDYIGPANLMPPRK